MTEYPPLQVVDENDNPIGGATFKETYDKGLIHRVSMISVRDINKRFLLQKRSKKVATNPGRWDISVAGHVEEGHGYLEAAHKELSEEIGITAVNLKEIAYYKSETTANGYNQNRFIKIFEVTIPEDTEFVIEQEEVEEVRWFTLDELADGLENNRDSYNNDFDLVLAKIK